MSALLDEASYSMAGLGAIEDAAHMPEAFPPVPPLLRGTCC